MKKSTKIIVFVLLLVGGALSLKLYFSHNLESEFFKAVSNGDVKKISILIKEGVDTNMKNHKNGWTPLDYASVLGNMKIVKILIDNGAFVDDRAKDGSTALMIAVTSKEEHLDTIKMLIDNGADVNAVSNDGTTALMLASFLGHKDVVKLLIDNGADVNIKSKSGSTALKLARLLGHGKVVVVLVNAGAK